LIELLGEHALCLPHAGDHYHPLAAVYRVGVLDVVRRLLAAKRLRPVFLMEEVPTRIVEVEEWRDVDPTSQTLRNLNTPDEYAAALRDAR
jgi:molybdopterin-guanine dinucleotide biosynthesis protein A